MKRYHLRRRLIASILAIECALMLVVTAATLWNARQEQIRAFDLMLRGRADSLLGAVQDAEDAADSVRVNPQALDLPKEDLWQVTNATGQVLAHSAGWTSGVADFANTTAPHDLRYHGRHFRGMTLRGVRQVDADDQNPGIPRPVRIDYAASLQPVHRSLVRTEHFLILSNAILLVITGIVMLVLLRRGLAPLEELSRAVTRMTPSNPEFQIPAAASRVAELSVLTAALHSSTQQLQHALRQQEIFVHDAAHELKTAVTIVKSSLQLLSSRRRTTEEYMNGLETCLSDCSRMEDLVQRMLLLARFEQGSLPADAADLTEAIQEVAAQMETFAEIRRVTLRVETCGPAWVPISAEACASLLSSLTLNALQHTPVNGIVAIHVSIAEGKVLLLVRDNGAGIAPEELPHIFDRFYRGDASRARTSGGTGLGLSICKAIADRCGGTISVESAVGQGTTVTVQLPCAPTAASAKCEASTDHLPNVSPPAR